MALSIGVVILALLASLGGSYALTLYVQHQNNQQWCSALNLLTSQKQEAPANPAANPSREQGYQLYEDFLAIEQHFGC